jgi:hypothetical protein
MDGIGMSRIVTYEVVKVSSRCKNPLGSIGKQHIGPFMLWAVCIIVD